jgi:hypothetical protein
MQFLRVCRKEGFEFIVFFILNEYGRRAQVFKMCARNFTILHAGAVCQLKIGQKGLICLRNFIKTLINVGVVEFWL